MANTLTGLIPTLYEALNIVNREFIGFIPAVHRDTGEFRRAAKGQIVSVFVAPAVTATDIVPGVTPPNSGSQNIGRVDITIDKSRMVDVLWNGEEQLGLNNNGPTARAVMVDQFAQAYRTLTNEIEVDLSARAYKAASRAFGTPGTAPFGTAGDLSDSAGVAQILDDNGSPPTGRSLVLNSAAMANIRGKQNVLFKVNEAGTDSLLRDGMIGRLEGFNLRYSAAVKPVVKGTGAGYTTNTAGHAVGATAITLITGTGTVLAGDHVTFAGDSNKYVVTTGIAAPGVITLAQPGLRVAIPAAATAMTIGDDYTPNMAFTRDALVLATRMPAVPTGMTGNSGDMAADRVMVQDPFSGIAFEVSLYRLYRQIKFEVGLAWGTAAIKSENIATLIG